MIKRLFWFLIGAAVGIFVLFRLRRSLEQAHPQAVGHRVGRRVVDARDTMGAKVNEFVATVRREAADYEAELRETLNMPDPE